MANENYYAGSRIQIATVVLTTDGSGAATATTPPINGCLRHIYYKKTDFTDGVDFTIVGAVTGMTVWTQANVNASVVMSPHIIAQYTDGIEFLYSTGNVVANVLYLSEALLITIASGGASKTGTLYFIVEG